MGSEPAQRLPAFASFDGGSRLLDAGAFPGKVHLALAVGAAMAHGLVAARAEGGNHLGAAVVKRRPMRHRAIRRPRRIPGGARRRHGCHGRAKRGCAHWAAAGYVSFLRRHARWIIAFEPLPVLAGSFLWSGPSPLPRPCRRSRSDRPLPGRSPALASQHARLRNAAAAGRAVGSGVHDFILLPPREPTATLGAMVDCLSSL